jgi:hypothetical protein
VTLAPSWWPSEQSFPPFEVYMVGAYAVQGFVAGCLVDNNIISSRMAFSVWLISPWSLPLVLGGTIFAGLVKLFKWWLFDPLLEWKDSKKYIITPRPGKKKKPTWDELEVLWQEVSVQLEKLGVPEPPRPKVHVSDKPIRSDGYNRCMCSSDRVCQYHAGKYSGSFGRGIAGQ